MIRSAISTTRMSGAITISSPDPYLRIPRAAGNGSITRVVACSAVNGVLTLGKGSVIEITALGSMRGVKAGL